MTHPPRLSRANSESRRAKFANRAESGIRILVACECSGVVRDAFSARGFDAWSCDIVPAKRNCEVQHIMGDVLDVLDQDWTAMIAHPPCTYLASSGAGWLDHPKYPNRRQDQEKAAGFFMALANAAIEHIAIENPVGVMSTRWRKPDQIIQPYQFGHPESKKTCLWLKNLPPLAPTNEVEPVWHTNPDGTDYRDSRGKRYSPTHYLSGRMQKRLARWENQTASGQNKIAPGPLRQRLRSTTYQGIAAAMAEQWGNHILERRRLTPDPRGGTR